MAQPYQAIHGSSFAGSLGAVNNPAAIVHMPFAWDISPFAIQARQSTNAFTVTNFSLLSPGTGAAVKMNSGESKQYLMAGQDMRLLNARIRTGSHSAIAGGASIRSYQSLTSSKLRWNDSTETLQHLLQANTGNSPLSAELRAQAWAELYATYARTLLDDGNQFLNAGVTMKVNRGLGGAYGYIRNFGYTETTIRGQQAYLLRSGEAGMGYSANIDELDNGGTAAEKRKRLYQKSYSSISASIGFEYVRIAETAEDGYDYDLKLGLSLLDLGFNKYQHSTNSVRSVLSKDQVTDSLVSAVFSGISSVDDLPDSLQVLAGDLTYLTGKFRMLQPARIVLNADKKIADRVYLNGELTLPITAIFGKQSLYVREISMLALTPRYESGILGFYIPLTFTSRNQFWAGAALKAGPILLGLHNLANLVNKNSMQNGGAYLAFTFRPSAAREAKQSSDRSGREQTGRTRGKKGSRNLGCPKF